MFWNVPLDQVTAVYHGSGACQDAKSSLFLSHLVFPGPREVLNPVPGAQTRQRGGTCSEEPQNQRVLGSEPKGAPSAL